MYLKQDTKVNAARKAKCVGQRLNELKSREMRDCFSAHAAVLREREREREKARKVGMKNFSLIDQTFLITCRLFNAFFNCSQTKFVAIILALWSFYVVFRFSSVSYVFVLKNGINS